MKKVILTVTQANCRSGYFKPGQSFVVGDLCPPICHELWNRIYPYVFTLQNGGSLDQGDFLGLSFDAMCPDGGKVVIHGELFDENV